MQRHRQGDPPLSSNSSSSFVASQAGSRLRPCKDRVVLAVIPTHDQHQNWNSSLEVTGTNKHPLPEDCTKVRCCLKDYIHICGRGHREVQMAWHVACCLGCRQLCTGHAVDMAWGMCCCLCVKERFRATVAVALQEVSINASKYSTENYRSVVSQTRMPANPHAMYGDGWIPSS